MAPGGSRSVLQKLVLCKDIYSTPSCGFKPFVCLQPGVLFRFSFFV